MTSEQPVYTANSDWSSHIGGYLGVVFMVFLAIVAWVITPIFGVVIIAAAILGIVMVELIRRADSLVLYNDGVAREYKLLSTSRTFAEYTSIQDLAVTQTFIERLFKVGTIHINTAGSSTQEIVFPGLKRFEDVESAIRHKMERRSIDTPAV